MTGADPVLTLHLWDLRAQVEAQLRCLTTVQHKLDALPDSSATSFSADKAVIIKDLSDILAMNASIREVSQLALGQAQTLGTDVVDSMAVAFCCDAFMAPIVFTQPQEQ
jgi:hypothetical protein